MEDGPDRDKYPIGHVEDRQEPVYGLFFCFKKVHVAEVGSV